MAQHRANEALPLSAIRIADFGWVMAGAIPGQVLGDMGAQVIKVESARRLDMTRRWGSSDKGVDVNASPGFLSGNRNKLSVTLNLATPEGVALAKRLVQVSDIAVENFAGQVMEKLGLSYHALRAVKPDIIMLSMAPAGHRGLWTNLTTYGPAVGGLAGLEGLVGYPGEPPIGSQLAYVDPLAGVYGTFALLAALRYRARTGRGVYIDLSQHEAAVSTMGRPLLEYAMTGTVTSRMGNRHRWMAPHGCYPCREANTWVVIAVGTEEEWKALRRAMGDPEWARRPEFASMYLRHRHQESLDVCLSAWTRSYSPYELTALLQEQGVAATPSLDSTGVLKDPHLQERETFLRMDHPAAKSALLAGMAWRLLGTPGRVSRPAPLLGEHTGYVLEELLGLPQAEVDSLRQSQAVC